MPSHQVDPSVKHVPRLSGTHTCAFAQETPREAGYSWSPTQALRHVDDTGLTMTWGNDEGKNVFTKSFTKHFSKRKKLYKRSFTKRFQKEKSLQKKLYKTFSKEEDIKAPRPKHLQDPTQPTRTPTNRKIQYQHTQVPQKRETKKSERTTLSQQQHKHSPHGMHSYLMH